MMKPEFTATPHIGDDRCLDLVQGLLGAEERQATLRHLKLCHACEDRFQQIAASHARGLSAVASVLQKSQPTSASRVPLRPRTRTWILAAASVAALVGVVRFTSKLSPEVAVVTGPESRLPQARLRGAVRELGVAAADTALSAGLDAYNRNDFAGARRWLETARVGGRWESVRRIYLGSTLLELGEPAGAVAVLRYLDVRLVPEPWKSEARWTLAMALARTSNATSADSILTVLSRERGPVAERARAHLASTSRVR